MLSHPLNLDMVVYISMSEPTLLVCTLYHSSFISVHYLEYMQVTTVKLDVYIQDFSRLFSIFPKLSNMNADVIHI